MNRGFVFDLDGTLVDSLPGIAKGLNLALESLGLPAHQEQEIRGMVGKGARELCKSALGDSYCDESITALLHAFMREYPHTWKNGTVPYSGMYQLLIDLQKQGTPIGVLSNKPHIVTEPLVKNIFPKVDFNIIMGYSPQFPRKPDPSALLHIIETWGIGNQSATMIGDSKHDAETAINANTGLVLVGWGYSPRSSLSTYAAPICETPEELRNMLFL